MPKRSPPSRFAIERGKVIRQARRQQTLSQTDLAKKLGKESRESVSQYENGKVETIDVTTCRLLVGILGLEANQLTRNPAMLENFSDQIPEVSGQARRVARAWDSLPVGLQEFMWQQIVAFEKLQQEDPLLAQLTLRGPAKDAPVDRTKTRKREG